MTNVTESDGGPTTTSLAQEGCEYDICPNSAALNKVIELLTETVWDAPLASLQSQLSELRLQVGLPLSSTSKEMRSKGGGKKSSATGLPSTTPPDELESYESLVKDAGTVGGGSWLSGAGYAIGADACDTRTFYYNFILFTFSFYCFNPFNLANNNFHFLLGY